VFKNGRPQGFIGSIPKGGHIPPIHIDGDKALWKNAQKKEKKNITSDTINNFIPSFNPFLT
jgi:N-glycosylase/DNA lyase